MAKSSLVPLLLVVVLSVAAAQVYDNCPLITESDLGNFSAPSNVGLVAERLSAGQADSPMVEIFGYNIVCLAAGTVRGTYRALSVVVFYRCSEMNLCNASPLGYEGNATSQFEFGCVGSTWESIVENSRAPSATFTDPANATLDTEASTDCSFCLHENARNLSGFPLAIDGITHCGECPSSCLDPPGLCTGLVDGSCCNVYDNDTCAVSCPAGEAPDADYDCVAQCPELDDPTNGTVTTTETRLERSEAVYRCDNGFSLLGTSTRICQESSSWSSIAPICVEVDCGDLLDPENGQVTFQDTTLGSVATYSCNSGYDLEGEEERTCQESGEWSDSAPVCEESGGGLGGGAIAGIVIGVVVAALAAIVTGVVIGVWLWQHKKTDK